MVVPTSPLFFIIQFPVCSDPCLVFQQNQGRFVHQNIQSLLITFSHILSVLTYLDIPSCNIASISCITIRVITAANLLCLFGALESISQLRNHVSS